MGGERNKALQTPILPGLEQQAPQNIHSSACHAHALVVRNCANAGQCEADKHMHWSLIFVFLWVAKVRPVGLENLHLRAISEWQLR